MRSTPFLLLGGAIAAPATAGTVSVSVSVTLARPNVAEYHKPYVAVWLEPAGGGAERTLALWYEGKKGGAEPGSKWLPDLRAWWRKGGRGLALPADGITGPTRGPGQYTIALPADLKPGPYVLNVESAREAGGRELVSVPVSLPAGGGRASGATEIGAVTVAAR